MTSLPPEITYGYVTGRFIAAWTDGPDAGRTPDPRPLEGLTVKITPKVQVRRLAGASPVLVATMPVTCKVDADGRPMVRYDSSPEHVRASLEGSLARLGEQRVDTLIIHRPDVLTPVADTVRAFLDAREAGLVGKLGVSNLGVGRVLEFQRELESQAADGTGLACVQVELGLHHRTLVEAVVLANHPDAPADADAGRLGPVCAAEGIELQAWGPLGQGRFSSGDDGAAGVVGEVAAELGVSREAVVLAWLLRLPWGVRPVIGTSAHQLARVPSASRTA